MRYRLIGCEIFARPVYHAAANSRHIIDVCFTKLQSHVKPDLLREDIQRVIDGTFDQYDAILLCFGLCGNATAGLVARSLPLVIPRAHDCCTIFTGSRASFLKYFGRTPSAQWYTACYYERLGGWNTDYAYGMLSPGLNTTYAGLVEKYGEENARYIMEMMNTHNDVDFLTYIQLPGFDNCAIREAFTEYAKQQGKNTRFITGSTRLIDKLVNGEWDDEEFLVVPPGAQIKAIYDHDRILGI